MEKWVKRFKTIKLTPVYRISGLVCGEGKEEGAPADMHRANSGTNVVFEELIAFVNRHMMIFYFIQQITILNLSRHVGLLRIMTYYLKLEWHAWNDMVVMLIC